MNTTREAAKKLTAEICDFQQKRMNEEFHINAENAVAMIEDMVYDALAKREVQCQIEQMKADDPIRVMTSRDLSSNPHDHGMVADGNSLVGDFISFRPRTNNEWCDLRDQLQAENERLTDTMKKITRHGMAGSSATWHGLNAYLLAVEAEIKRLGGTLPE
jgi:urease gamma subunit